MGAQINIGQDPAGQALALDLEELLATRLLVQGNSGSGKSHLLRRLLEECAGLVQQVVIDPEGDFVTLADHFDHVVIDGAAYTPHEIAALAGRVRRHRASVVLALEELEVEQQIRCAAIFLSALFDAPREHWYPALVVVDEAQMFAPAAAGEMSDDTRRMTLSAMTNLMCRGRKRGLAGIVATQRLAKLAKNVAAEASNFLMGRTFLDIDMQRAADLLGMDRRQAERIRDLQRGQFLGLGPAISRRPVAVQVGPVRTAGKNAAQKLIPLPAADGEVMEALLTTELAEAANAQSSQDHLPARRPARDLEDKISAAAVPPNTDVLVEKPSVSKSSQESSPHSASLPVAAISQPPSDGIAAIIRDLAATSDATFRSSAALYRDFAICCRQSGIASAHIDLAQFCRLFAGEVAGLNQVAQPLKTAIETMVQHVDSDVLAPYLSIVIAAATGQPNPSEEKLAYLYGSSSPSRVRRLLDHLERCGLIVVREDFSGERNIIVPRLADLLDQTEGSQVASAL